MKNQEFWVASGAGCAGGLLGAVSGSSSLFVVGAVGAGMGFLVVWLISGFLK